MEITFFRFNHAWKKSEVLIQPKIEFDTLELIGTKSPLIHNPNFEIKKGKKLFDILSFNNSLNFAISSKFKQLLLEHKIKKWSCFPIIIDGISEQYYVFQNLSEAGSILNLEAFNNYEDDCMKFDVSTWDKSDIFHLKDTLVNVCTKEVKELIEKNKLTNVEFTPCLGISF